VAADTFAAVDVPKIETGPNTAFRTPLNDVVAIVAEIVAAWLTIAIEAVGWEAAEILVVVKPRMVADFENTGPGPSGSYPW
jgi:hypothetical protein